MNDMGAHFGTVNFERRKHPRFSVNLPVEYRKVDNSKGHPANTGDVSEGGLLIYVSEPISIGQEMFMKLFFASGNKVNSIQARAQVVWKDMRIGIEGGYRIGVKFIDISADALTLMKEFLDNLITLKSAKELIDSPSLFPDN
jgi:c-di-GMP-binding flagellar brake protein YcgR